MVSAAAQTVFAVVLDRRPLASTWARVVVVEILLGFGLVVGLLVGIADHERLRMTLEGTRCVERWQGRGRLEQ
ncbi:hypothetical protein [Micromonospora rhizosphaerae]|uniref:hypothetical protein n=1 Tax=Micromonospora rhizosphaerae TaxID=568872 RepID=UPI00114D274C|nr:hypothetical protein [Micromonospora rhizosphaerae]